jgi:Tol biopolymer transport system component
MTRNRRAYGAVRAALVIVALMLMACPALAELRLDVTRGKVEPMPIAIPAFAGAGGEEAQTGRDMAQVISADLERSGLFRPLDPRSFIQTVSAGEGPRFGDWRQINAQALVTGSLSVEGDKIRLIANADVVVTLEEKKIRAARQVGMTFVRQPVRLAHSFPRRRRGVGIKSSEHSSSSL